MSEMTVATQKSRFSVAINSEAYRKLINSTLGDPNRARRFVASVTSAVAVNPALRECTPQSIISGALLGESLNLSPSPQLGMYYLVPFETKAKYKDGRIIEPACTNAIFVLGYKGYLQLALRSGEYADIDTIEIREGEYLGRDSLTGKPRFKFYEDDYDDRPIVGYLAYFEYQNGFRKSIYWSREKMIDHADKFSPAFSREAITTKTLQKVSFADYEAGNYPKEDKKYSSFWYRQFDDMAKKTLIRQLISKWGIMSIETQAAISSDGNVVGGQTLAYVTNNDVPDNGLLPQYDESPPLDDQPQDEDAIEDRPQGEVSLDDL